MLFEDSRTRRLANENSYHHTLPRQESVIGSTSFAFFLAGRVNQVQRRKELPIEPAIPGKQTCGLFLGVSAD